MGVQPPQDDTSSPDIVEFGIAALDARLDEADIDYPATTEEIVTAIDDTQVPYDAAGHTLDLEDALREVPQARFDSETELKEVLHPVFENRRATGASGVLGRLRTLLPF